MTSIQGRRCLRRERTSKGPSGFLLLLEFSHDKGPVNPPAESPVTKYTEEDLQKILRMVFKSRAPPSDGSCEKSLKAKLPDVYCGKSHMECYNFCQKCEDHFAIVGAKGPNRISFAASFLGDRINICWQQ